MRVRMVTLAAGPEGVLQAGGVYNLPAKLAQALIEAGAAVEVKFSQAEAAALEAPEKAIKPAARRRRPPSVPPTKGEEPPSVPPTKGGSKKEAKESTESEAKNEEAD